MPTEKKLLEALDRDTIDTSKWSTGSIKDKRHFMDVAENKAYGVGIPQIDGTLRSWHVTDEPAKVIDLLKAKGDFYASEGDLCGGLYVSAVPHYWEGRSQKKWDFLPKMSKESRFKLYEAIKERLVEEINTGYITRSEFERADEDIEMAKKQDFWQILDIVANQPFNVDIPRLAEKLGLAVPFKPPYIQVDFVGRYLEFNTQRAIEANEALLLLKHGSTKGLSRLDLCNMLKEYGWDGVYTKAGMGTNPELVIWNGDRVMAFGDYMPDGGHESAALSGPRREGIWIPADRFEATVNASRTLVNIHDRLLKGTFISLTHEQVFEMQRMMREILGPPRTSNRFETRRLYNSPQIYDRQSKYYFRGMGNKDISELNQLIAEILNVMST